MEDNKNVIEEIEEVEDIVGTEGEEGTTATKESSEGNNPNAQARRQERTFTQRQVSRMMTKEKNQGRNSVYNEMGIDPTDTETIAAIKAFVGTRKTAEQKAAEQATETQNKLAEAERKVHLAEIKVEAMMLGVQPQYVDDIVTLTLAKMNDSEEMDEDAVKTALSAFKNKYPTWFGSSEQDIPKDKVGQKGTGSSIVLNNKGTKKEEGIGARLAAQRKVGKVASGKKSYWGH